MIEKSETPAVGDGEAAVFDADNYLYFYAELFHSSARTRQELDFLTTKLRIKNTDTVIDVGCGHGRHALGLALVAKFVLGIDMSERFIAKASEHAAACALHNLELRVQDMRLLDVYASFHCAVLVNTILGLHDDDETHNVLCRINRSLYNGGLLCVDVVNRDPLLRDFPTESAYKIGDDMMIDRFSFDRETSRVINRRVYLRNGVRKEAPFSLRVFNFAELADLLGCAGFRVQSAWGDWDSVPFAQDSKKIVVIAEKISQPAKPVG